MVDSLPIRLPTTFAAFGRQCWIKLVTQLKPGSIPASSSSHFAEAISLSWFQCPVMDRLLTGSEWFAESAKKPMLELRRFFSERLYDPSLEQEPKAFIAKVNQ
jgi:hypothetical protein